MDAVVAGLLDKGGLLGMLLVGAVLLLMRAIAKNDALQADRVADAKQTRDDVVTVNKSLVETMALTRQALDANTKLLERLCDDDQEQPGSRRPADDTQRRRPPAGR